MRYGYCSCSYFIESEIEGQGIYPKVTFQGGAWALSPGILIQLLGYSLGVGSWLL